METEPTTRPNLPSQPTPFIGREVEIEEITPLLTGPACRLLTLVGAGDIGKSRLAIEIATRRLDAFSTKTVILYIKSDIYHYPLID